MATSVRTPAVLAPRPRAETIEQSRARPIVWWAVLGAGFVALQMYIQLSWILSDDFRHVGTGATPVPTYMVISARFNEVVFFSFMVGVIYFFAIRPWLRDGRFTLDGLLVLVLLLHLVAGPAVRLRIPRVELLGRLGEHGRLGGSHPRLVLAQRREHPRALLWVLPFYIGLGGAGSILCAAAMRRWRARNPRVHTATMLLGVYCAWFLFDLALELFWVRTGLYTYAGAWDHLLLFKGHWYQFPLYEPFCVGLPRVGLDDVPLLRQRPRRDDRRAGAEPAAGRFEAAPGHSVPRPSRHRQRGLPLHLIPDDPGVQPAQRSVAEGRPEALVPDESPLRPGHELRLWRQRAARPVKEKSVSIGPNGQLVIPPGFDIGKITAPPVRGPRTRRKDGVQLPHPPHK